MDDGRKYVLNKKIVYATHIIWFNKTLILSKYKNSTMEPILKLKW